MGGQYPEQSEVIGTVLTDGRTPEQVAVLARLGALELRLSEAAWRLGRAAEECEELESLLNQRGLPDELASGPVWERVGRAASQVQVRWDRWRVSMGRVVGYQNAVVKARDAREG